VSVVGQAAACGRHSAGHVRIGRGLPHRHEAAPSSIAWCSTSSSAGFPGSNSPSGWSRKADILRFIFITAHDDPETRAAAQAAGCAAYFRKIDSGSQGSRSDTQGHRLIVEDERDTGYELSTLWTRDNRSPSRGRIRACRSFRYRRAQHMNRTSIEMRIMNRIALIPLLAALAVAPAAAQQVTGELGSPSATTTIDGKQLPPPPVKFGGVIKESVKESKPWWPPRVVPPKGAPNVLLIMTDDQGYGVSGTFGGVIPTPAMDRIAKAGLRYTHFHSAALCSPTRAALVTGRNHHSVGFGIIGELSTGYPGYDSIIGPENATVGRILSDNGYSTSWFGKNHNTPGFQYSVSGPFDQWPSGMGFQYFYGFMGGETDQWQPYLFRDHTQIFPWIGRRTTTSPPTWRTRRSGTCAP
jgi:hypothetical protein